MGDRATTSAVGSLYVYVYMHKEDKRLIIDEVQQIETLIVIYICVCSQLIFRFVLQETFINDIFQLQY